MGLRFCGSQCLPSDPSNASISIRVQLTHQRLMGLLFGVDNARGKDGSGAEGGHGRDNGALRRVSWWAVERADMPYLPEQRSESHHERGAGAMDGRMGASLVLR
jgi:hypothetical protein